MTSFDMAVTALVLAPIVDWVATFVLAWYGWRQRNRGLRERAVAAAILTVIATIIAVLSWAYLAKVDLGDVGTTFFMGALLCVTLPQLIWLVLFLLGKFR